MYLYGEMKGNGLSVAGLLRAPSGQPLGRHRGPGFRHLFKSVKSSLKLKHRPLLGVSPPCLAAGQTKALKAV